MVQYNTKGVSFVRELASLRISQAFSGGLLHILVFYFILIQPLVQSPFEGVKSVESVNSVSVSVKWIGAK